MPDTTESANPTELLQRAYELLSPIVTPQELPEYFQINGQCYEKGEQIVIPALIHLVTHHWAQHVLTIDRESRSFCVQRVNPYSSIDPNIRSVCVIFYPYKTLPFLALSVEAMFGGYFYTYTMNYEGGYLKRCQKQHSFTFSNMEDQTLVIQNELMSIIGINRDNLLYIAQRDMFILLCIRAIDRRKEFPIADFFVKDRSSY